MSVTKQKRRPPEHPCTYYGDRIKVAGLSLPFAAAPQLAEKLSEARVLLRSWVAALEQPRRQDYEIIVSHLLEDSEKFLKEKSDGL